MKAIRQAARIDNVVYEWYKKDRNQNVHNIPEKSSMKEEKSNTSYS